MGPGVCGHCGRCGYAPPRPAFLRLRRFVLDRARLCSSSAPPRWSGPCLWSTMLPTADDLPEWEVLQRLIELGGRWLQVRELGQVQLRQVGGALRRLPLLCVTLGNPDPACPGIGVFGGVHGLERIGSEVVLGCLHHYVHRLPWDGLLQQQLEHLRLVLMPLVNPGGLARGTRANPNGVDLMRNAPLQASEAVPFRWPSTAIPASGWTTGSGFPLPTAVIRSSTCRSCMRSRSCWTAGICTTPMSSSRRAASTWPMVISGITSTCVRAAGRRTGCSCRSRWRWAPGAG